MWLMGPAGWDQVGGFSDVFGGVQVELNDMTFALTLTLPTNPMLVAADVRRRTTLQLRGIRLLMSAATVRGLSARIWIRRILSPRKRAGVRASVPR